MMIDEDIRLAARAPDDRVRGSKERQHRTARGLRHVQRPGIHGHEARCPMQEHRKLRECQCTSKHMTCGNIRRERDLLQPRLLLFPANQVDRHA